MSEAFIAGAVRTPVANFNGSLAQLPATRLGAIVIEEAVKRPGISPGSVDCVYMSAALCAGLGAAPARRAALEAGLPNSVKTVLVTGGPASSLQTVLFALAEVSSGGADIVIAGGMESVSKSPYLLEKARFGYRHGNGELIDSIINDGLKDSYGGFHIGESAETVAARYGIGRTEQDLWAGKSCSKAIEAMKKGVFDREIAPIMIPVGPDRFASVNSDEGPQKHETLRLSTIPPLFKDGGTVTSGNSSGISDGAAAVSVISAGALKRFGVTPVARVIGAASAGVEPEMFSVAPYEAVRKLLKKTGLKVKDIDLFEINEDFAVSTLAIIKEAGIDGEKVNVAGGAIALGNPLGASGARVLTTLVHAMAARGAKRGVAAASSVGGLAVALLVERVEGPL
ncbi:MAG: thiolase family protein [Deltaproteobacteria bacterium]|nr:thiolase family protein [Deltaproteobacteria bacterium]